MGGAAAVRAVLLWFWGLLRFLAATVRSLIFPTPAMSETKSIERGLGVLGILWGVALLFSARTFLAAPALWWLGEHTDEHIVGYVFIALGVVKLFAPLLRSLLLRAVVAAAGCLAWVAIAFSVVVSVDVSTSWVLYGWLAWLSSYDYMELLARYLHQRAVLALLYSQLGISNATPLPTRKVSDRERHEQRERLR